MADERLDISVIPFEFPSGSAARKAFQGLDRWLRHGDHDDVSAYRLADADGVARIIVAITAELGHVAPIIRRLHRAGGTWHDLPQSDERGLLKRTSSVGMQGRDAGRSYKDRHVVAGTAASPDRN